MEYSVGIYFFTKSIMKEKTEQDFNWWFAKIFIAILWSVRLIMLFIIIINFDNFLSVSKEYWDLFIIVFWGIGYFSTSMVMFHKKALAVKNSHHSEIPYHERVSPAEASYYPVWLFLSSWFLISIITKEPCKYWIIIWITVSIVYLLWLFCFINSIEDPKEEKESRKV